MVKIFISTLLVFIIAGCSTGRKPPIINNFECQHPAISELKNIQTTKKDPSVYKLIINQQIIFNTSMSECNIRDYVPTKATSRQLLSGFDKLKIIEEGFLTSNHIGDKDSQKNYYLLALAELDSKPINLIAISTRKRDCVNDTIFWQHYDVGSLEQTNNLKESVFTIVECIN